MKDLTPIIAFLAIIFYITVYAVALESGEHCIAQGMISYVNGNNFTVLTDNYEYDCTFAGDLDIPGGATVNLTYRYFDDGQNGVKFRRPHLILDGYKYSIVIKEKREL